MDMEQFEKRDQGARFDKPADNIDAHIAAETRDAFERRNLNFDMDSEREGLMRIHERSLERRNSLEAEIRAVEQNIADLKATLISKIISRGRIQSLEAKLSVLQSEAESETKRALRYAEYEESFDALAKQDQERTALLEQERKEAVEDAQVRDVRKQIEDHGCFFVHDIIEADWKPSANNRTIDTKSVSFVFSSTR